jgi:hypothetical protein
MVTTATCPPIADEDKLADSAAAAPEDHLADTLNMLARCNEQVAAAFGERVAAQEIAERQASHLEALLAAVKAAKDASDAAAKNQVHAYGVGTWP